MLGAKIRVFTHEAHEGTFGGKEEEDHYDKRDEIER
jgi:hypothetical protein